MKQTTYSPWLLKECSGGNKTTRCTFGVAGCIFLEKINSRKRTHKKEIAAKEHKEHKEGRQG